MTRLPISVPWENAPEAILALAAARAGGPRAIVGVGGPVGAGKSTLARRLSSCVVATDHYLPDYEAVEERFRDEPEHADLDRLARDLERLRRGTPTRIPRWSFLTHRREGEDLVEPPPVAAPSSAGDPPALVVCEGIHALAASVAAVLDVAVFVDSDTDARWARWEAIERRGERGWGVEIARRYFDQVAEPAFLKRRAAYLAAAHVVVLNPSRA